MSNTTSSTSPSADEASPSSPSSAPSSLPPPSSSPLPTESSTAAAPTTASSAPSPSQNPPSSEKSLTSPPSSAPPSTQPPSSAPPTSTPVNLPSSSPPPSQSQPPSSQQSQPANSATESSTNSQPPSNTPASTTTAPTPTPTTEVITSVITQTPTKAGETPVASTVLVTRTHTNNAAPTGGRPGQSANPTDTAAPGLQDPKGSKATAGGLSTGGRTAIAVVVPVVVVALLLIAGILLWRRRKSKKNAEEARRKEVEEYGFNPNHDPTLPAVGMQSEMAEDQSGYRGWGNTTTSSNRKASTTLTSGMAYSDSNSNPGGYQSPVSPVADNHSGDGLMNNRRGTMDSEGISALGAAPNGQRRSSVNRGPSNASSSYSGADRSDNSGDYPTAANNGQEFYNGNNQDYYHASPYDPSGYGAPPQPIIRDVSARRNTRIENPSVFPQPGNSGIAQNF